MGNTFVIGVDLGGTNLRVGSYALGVALMETITLSTRLADGPHEVVRDMCEAIQVLSAKTYGEARCGSVGIGAPGPLELPLGIVRNPPNLSGWDGFNLRAAIEQRLNRTVLLENDANLAALAEQRLGTGKSHYANSLCMLTLGTGVGSGLILDGSIWNGSMGMAGEAGHIPIDNRREVVCGCGGSGCLEQFASATAIVRMARQNIIDDPGLTAFDVAQIAASGDRRALSIYDTVGWSLAVALTGLINSLNLSLHVIGGGVSDSWELFSPELFRELHRRSVIYRLTSLENSDRSVETSRATKVLRAELGSRAGLLGACLLAQSALE